MSDNDNSDVRKGYPSKASAPVSRAYVAPVQTWTHNHNANVIGLMRASLEHDHGMAANDLPNSDESVIDAWAKIVTKNGTFDNALAELTGE
jgi:hypothetical protein